MTHHSMTRILTALVCLMAATAAHALDVSTTAGRLAASVADPASVAELRVAGSLDAADFHFIATSMPALTTLDLGAATIAAYDGEPIDGIRHFAAGELPPMLLAGTALETLVLPADISSIGYCALADTHLKAVSLPATLKSIGSGAFAGCKQLQCAECATAALGDATFASCTALEQVKLTAAATVAGARCFDGCTALTSVEGSENIAVIADDAFRGCSSLADFAFAPGLKSIGARAFSGSGLQSADLEACTALASVGSAAFSRCEALKTLSLPEGCDAAEARALALNSPAIAEAALPVAEIPAYALADDSAVATLTLPAGLEYIGDNAMAGMTGLTAIDAKALTSVPELGTEVWKGVDQSKVKLDASDAMAGAFRAAAQWQDFNITGGATGSIDAVAEPKISARFAGYMLEVDCTGADVESVTVADIEGRILAVLTPEADGIVRLDTAPWHTDIYLLSASGPGLRASLKLVRTI